MIAYKYSYSHAYEDGDDILVEINVDKEFIDVMMKAVYNEIADAAFYLKDADADDIDGCINHIKDMIGSYKNLRKALEDIACKEGVLQIPPDDDEQG